MGTKTARGASGSFVSGSGAGRGFSETGGGNAASRTGDTLSTTGAGGAANGNSSVPCDTLAALERDLGAVAFARGRTVFRLVLALSALLLLDDFSMMGTTLLLVKFSGAEPAFPRELLPWTATSAFEREASLGP